MKLALLSTVALLLVGTAALAETKVTVGVGHMCCGQCKKSCADAVEKVSSATSIDGKNVTLTLKENDLVPALNALRKGGFPAMRIDAGSNPVTMTVGHLCCGGCKAGLKSALANARLDDLDLDAVKIGDDSVTVKAKEGKSLDLAPVLAAMEKGGFSATKIMIGGTSARQAPSHQKIVTR